MKPLTIVFTTARLCPQVDWFIDSLMNHEMRVSDPMPKVIIVDAMCSYAPLRRPFDMSFTSHVPPKPTVWQGQGRMTKQDWWAASNSRNTGICLCKTEWIAFVDDRSVLLPGWLDCIEEAMNGGYAVFGSYEKRTGIKVENGVITHAGIITGEDSRKKYVMDHRGGAAPTDCPGEWCFGCSVALPLEWALKVNGFDETCDGLSMEDIIFGFMLANNGLPLKYDHRMAIVEDRTPESCGPVMKREDKGISPRDKSHALLEMLRYRETAMHPINLRQIRQDLIDGYHWPKAWGPQVDFWDGQPISEM